LISRQLAVHVSAVGAHAIQERSDIPDDICGLLESGEAQWVPGLRVRSKRCLGPDGLQWRSYGAPVSFL
jgi:hypothetical protein